MDQPNLVVPRPYVAAESREVLERSCSLDLTPERPAGRKTVRKVGKDGMGTSSHSGHKSRDLSYPQIHSTAALQNRIEQLKLVQDQTRPQGTVSRHQPSDVRLPKATGTSLPSSSSSPGLSAGALPPKVLGVGMGVADDGSDKLKLSGEVARKSAKELNYGPGTCRYKDLISVDVSDESFQKLTFKPRKTRQPPQSKEKKARSPDRGQVTPREPQLMDLFIPSLEWEEASWSSVGMELRRPESVKVESDDVYVLHELLKELDSV